MIKKLSQGHWPIFLLSSFSSVGNLFLPIILVRILSPEDIGIYKIFFLHLTTLPFISMAGGPIHSVFYWIGKNPEERSKYLNATWTLTFFLSLLIIIIGLPMRGAISEQLDIPLQYVTILLVSGFLWTPGGHYSETTIASGKSGRGSLFDTFFEVTKVLGILSLAYHFKDLSYVFLYFMSLLAMKLLVSYFRNATENKVKFEYSPEALKKVVTYALPLSITGCLGFFIDKVDLLILSSLLDSSSFAFYSMGCLVVPPLYLLEMSVQKVLIPGLSKNFILKDWASASQIFRKSLSDISFLMIPAVFGLFTFAKPIVTLLYTDAYLDSVTYLKIFSLSYLLLIIPHDSVARATGHTKWILKVYLLITPLSFVVAYFSAKYYGAIGILIVTLLLKSIPKILGLMLSKKLMNWKWSEMFPFKHLSYYLGLSAILSGTSQFFRSYFESDMIWFFVCGSTFGVLYLGISHWQLKRNKYANH